MDKISVVVPAYNVEKYIEECITSICKQTYTNLEIIIVDDGSKDGTGKICDELAKIDDRILVIHKENGGLSDARNTGIEHATGKYLGFVDSDDYIIPTMYEMLYQKLKEEDADITQGRFVAFRTNGDFEEIEMKLPAGLISPKKMCLNLINAHCAETVVVWNKLYKKELFDQIRFPLGRIFEDEFIMHEVFLQCKKIYVLDEDIYFYRQNESSITHSYNIHHMDNFIAYKARVKYYLDHGMDDFADLMIPRYYEMLTKLFINVCKMGDEKDVELYKALKGEIIKFATYEGKDLIHLMK